MRRLTVLVVSIALSWAGGCKSRKSPVDASVPVDASTVDASAVDAGFDAGFDAGLDAGDGGSSASNHPLGVETTAGSGEVRSASHVLRLNVSSPLPVGSTSSANHRVVLGPRAPR